MELTRRKFQGVLNILSFNRHFYIYGFLVLIVLLGILNLLKINAFWHWLILLGFSYGFLMPLVVSAYVYDISGYYNFNWLKDLNISKSKTLSVVNINAGFDETSFSLKHHIPNSELKVFDFYNSKTHTEPAIVRARKASQIYPNTTQISTSKIPLKSSSVDLIFLLSTAHEIRDFDEKVRFLKACKRICKPNGNIIMVEHLRDLPNALAFTISVTHFFSKQTWNNAFKKAGFSLVKEQKFTPFMSIFNYKL